MLIRSRLLTMQIQLMLVISTALFCGCNPDWPELAGTAVVHGTVLMDGAPVSEAKIALVPTKLRNADDKLMALAYGKTDVEGKFELAYSDGTKELLAGTYTVMISKFKEANQENGQNNEPWRNALLPESVANLTMFSENGETIPSIYNSNSNLTYAVVASPSIIRHKFELTSIDPALRELGESESP